MNHTPRNANALREQGESAQQSNKQANHTDNSAGAQRARVYTWLKQFGSATTIELRRDCDCMMPAARIHELRHQFGIDIVTVWAHQPTDSGKLHRVARYVIESSQPSLFDEVPA